MSEKRRHFSDQQKADVVRRYLSDKVAVSDLADDLGVQPSQIHQWVKQVLDQAEKAFERSSGKRRAEQAKDRQIEQLRAKLADKHEVISELMEENVKAKKPMGNSERNMGSPRHSRRNRRLHQALVRADRTARQKAAGLA